MSQALLWIYLINATLIITHEIDSAYLKEWELFRLPGKISFFLVLHIFLVFIILLGIVLLFENLLWGLILSLVLSLAGIFAFSILRWFIGRGHRIQDADLSINISCHVYSLSGSTGLHPLPVH